MAEEYGSHMDQADMVGKCMVEGGINLSACNRRELFRLNSLLNIKN